MRTAGKGMELNSYGFPGSSQRSDTRYSNTDDGFQPMEPLKNNSETTGIEVF